MMRSGVNVTVSKYNDTCSIGQICKNKVEFKSYGFVSLPVMMNFFEIKHKYLVVI